MSAYAVKKEGGGSLGLFIMIVILLSHFFRKFFLRVGIHLFNGTGDVRLPFGELRAGFLLGLRLAHRQMKLQRFFKYTDQQLSL